MDGNGTSMMGLMWLRGAKSVIEKLLRTSCRTRHWEWLYRSLYCEKCQKRPQNRQLVQFVQQPENQRCCL